MQRILLPATITILVLLATLAACSGQALDPTAATTTTETPVPTEDPTERPTDAPTASPTEIPTTSSTVTPPISPTPEPTTTPAPDGRLAPLRLQDPGVLQSALSDAELACIGDDPEALTRALTGQGPTSQEEQAKLIGCINDENLARIFLAGFVPSPGPLSLETSDCIRAAFEIIDPRAVMTAGAGGDPEKAMAGSMAGISVTIACLTDEEWEANASQLGGGSGIRDGMQCLMETLGGPGQMATTVQAAQEGNIDDLALAGPECGLDTGPAAGPAPAATMATPTPVSTPERTGSTPAATAPTVPSTPAPTPATTLVITVAPVPEGIPEYDRDDWKHWVDEDGDCQDARQESLVEESLDEVTFETDQQCRVESGRWYGAFTGVYVENPGDLDIDHLVPLKNAHLSGGWRWDAEMREEYANDLSDPDHLIAVTASANRSKGAWGLEEWMPSNQDYWCQYATDWAEIKEWWELTMTKVESEIVMDMLGTCENPPDMEVEEPDYLN